MSNFMSKILRRFTSKSTTKLPVGPIHDDDIHHEVDEVVFEAPQKEDPYYYKQYHILWNMLNGLFHAARHYALSRKDGDRTSDEISRLVHSLYEACGALRIYDWGHYGKGFEDVDMMAWIENEDLVDGDGYLDEEEEDDYYDEEEYGE